MLNNDICYNTYNPQHSFIKNVGTGPVLLTVSRRIFGTRFRNFLGNFYDDAKTRVCNFVYRFWASSTIFKPLLKAVLLIRIRKDPKLFAGSESGSGSETGDAPYKNHQKIIKK
jgi:hypothetical protein